MDMLKKELAPLTDKAWDEINDRAREALKTQLSARKVLHVNGPNGWDYNVLTEGRLTNIEDNGKGVNSGIYQVKPLTEARVVFELNRWELDNIERGAKDIDLGPLEEAVSKIAEFEDNTVFNGLESSNIKGLKTEAVNNLQLGQDSSEIIANILEGKILLNNALAETPYSLIVGKDAWKIIQTKTEGYPLHRRIEHLIDGEIIFSKVIDGAFLIPFDHADLELTIGKDYAVGYENHDSKNVKLFITVSFTFRILDPEIIVSYSL